MTFFGYILIKGEIVKKGILLFSLVLSINLYGYFIGSLFQRGTVDIIITNSKNLVEHDSTTYDYYYKSKDEAYEIGLFCYAIDKNAGKNQTENSEMEFNVTSSNVMMYITERTSTIKKLEMNPREVNQINADVGFSTLISYDGHPSEYIGNFNYVMVNRYLKKDSGFIMEIIMFNDIALIEDKEFNRDIRIFKFK
jgi:hypothetical protein